MDALQNHILESLIGQQIPINSTHNEWAISLPVPVDTLQTRSFQQWVIHQPVKMGGLGIRSNVETRLPGFIGGLEQSVPHFVGEGVSAHSSLKFLGTSNMNRDGKPLLNQEVAQEKSFHQHGRPSNRKHISAQYILVKI